MQLCSDHRVFRVTGFLSSELGPPTPLTHKQVLPTPPPPPVRIPVLCVLNRLYITTYKKKESKKKRLSTSWFSSALMIRTRKPAPPPPPKKGFHIRVFFVHLKFLFTLILFLENPSEPDSGIGKSWIRIRNREKPASGFS